MTEGISDKAVKRLSDTELRKRLDATGVSKHNPETDDGFEEWRHGASLSDYEARIATSAWQAATARERERCARKAMEQRCERGTPWDRACVAIAAAIRSEEQADGR